MDRVLLISNIQQFALGGNATITLRSKNTGTYFTYKIKRSEDNSLLYFIHLLRGPDNENDYSYIGCYYEDTEVFHPCKKWKEVNKHNWPKSLLAIKYFFERFHNLPDTLEVYHEGKCARCGKKLTTPDSISLGFGPECRRYM